MFLLRNAQLGGIISGLIEGIGNVIVGWFQSIFGWLWYQIATALYTVIMMPLLLLIDGLSILFRKFAGLGSYTSGGVVYENNDFLYALITNESVKNVFWSMLILGVVLLFISTFVAVIKSETTPFDGKGENNKWKILKTTVRSLINFAIVPICAFVGIMIGNVLLRSLDSATGGGDGISIANRVFVSSAYQSNRVRLAMDLIENGENYVNDDDYIFANELSQQEFKKDFLLLNASEKNELARFVDDLFVSSSTSGNGCSCYNIYNVKYYYNIGNYNILLGIIEGIAINALMILLTVGLIKRLFAVVTLFVIAPPLIAITPIKPDVMKGWNSSFLAQVISGYAAVVTMNMYLIIMGAMSDIQFVSSSEFVFSGFINSIVMVLIAAAGLFFVKDISGEVAKLIGGADALGEGQKVAGKLAKSAAIGVGVGKAAAIATKSGIGRISAGKGLHTAKADTKKAKKELQRLEKEGVSKDSAAYKAQEKVIANAEKRQQDAKEIRDDSKKAFKSARTQLRDQSVQFGETFTETDFIKARQSDKIGDDMYYGKSGGGSKKGGGDEKASIRDRIKSQAVENKARKGYIKQANKEAKEVMKAQKNLDKNDPDYAKTNASLNQQLEDIKARKQENLNNIDVLKNEYSKGGAVSKEGQKLMKDLTAENRLLDHDKYIMGKHKGENRSDVAMDKVNEIKANNEKKRQEEAQRKAEDEEIRQADLARARRENNPPRKSPKSRG